MPELLPRLRQGVPIGTGPKGEEIYPAPEFILFWQQFANAIELIPGLAELVADAEAAAAAAQVSADNAQTSADDADAAAASVTSEQSIIASFPTNYTAPLIEADSTGNVTIANHQRQYGDTTLNPTVNVTGDTVATGEASPAIVRFYYSDPSRAGGAVTYQFTVDPADPPVQGGNIHSVGAVEIPAAGTQSGGAVNPPGFAPLP